MKKLLAVGIALLLLPLFGCAKEEKGPVVIVHCDGCGKELEYPADSGVTEDWILLCSDCNTKADRD